MAKKNRARDSVTVQGVAMISHCEHVGSGPGGAGPVGVVVKITHRFWVEPDAVVTRGPGWACGLRRLVEHAARCRSCEVADGVVHQVGPSGTAHGSHRSTVASLRVTRTRVSHNMAGGALSRSTPK